MKLLAVLFAGLTGMAWGQAVVQLRASHQFPSNVGDVRDEMMQLMARELQSAQVGLEIKVFANASLVRPQDQWESLVSGQIDLTALPLDYASKTHPEFGVTLMPGLVRNHAHAERLNHSPFMKEIRSLIHKGGATVLADAWLAGGMGGRDRCILEPKDIKGLKVRSAGATFAKMWRGAGAQPVLIPSSDIRSALQKGQVQAADTSSVSFVSFRLYDQIKCLTAPGEDTLWFMYQPVLISNKTLARLPPTQQKALIAAGKKAEVFFAKASLQLDEELIEVFRKQQVKVVTLSPAQAAQWRAIARETSYKEFATQVPGGQALIEKALAVQ